MPSAPTQYRVRLAFDFYSVGQMFVSPPMSRGYAETLRQRGFLEIVEAESVPTVAPAVVSTVEHAPVLTGKSKGHKR